MATFVRRGFSLLPRIAGVAALSSVAGLSALHLWTKQCYPSKFDPDTDPIFESEWIRKFNPHGNPTFHDCFSRDVFFSELNPVLLQDTLNGGSRLLEQFTAGVLGGSGFTIQRNIMKLARKDDTNSNDLWAAEEMLQSKYEKGTIVADDFVVIDKKPRSIMLRGGLSPRVNPNGPREMDVVMILEASVNAGSQLVTFRLKSVLFNGIEKGEAIDFSGVPTFLHRYYAKLLVTVGVEHCTR